MVEKIFGTDGIRGVSNSDAMSPELAMKVGMAVGRMFIRGSHKHRVVIGKDTRLSGYMIESALVAGFTSMGIDVFLLGPIPTPAVAMLTRSLRADMGVMISASHNKFEDNGIKLFGPKGQKLSDEMEGAIEKLLNEDLSNLRVAPRRIGRAKRIDGVHGRYMEFAKRTFPRNLRLDGVRIAIDCANGAAYKVAPEALWELGAEIAEIGTSPDGFNINDDCGSTSTEALCRKVHEVRADIGIALDGDADRVIIVDEKGKVVDGDQLLAVIAQSWSKKDRLTANGIVATVMSNFGLQKFLEGEGMNLARTDVGDRNVVQHMREHGYNVGGEQSGHIILSDFSATGDGLVAALQLLAVAREEDRLVSEICNKFEPYPQILRNVRLNGGKPLENKQVKEAIDDGEAALGGTGRIVIRPSGTEPLIRVMAEGEDVGLVKKVVNDIVSAVEAAA
ncbi:MAG: phosphoglucosamine mutase [Rhizobiales bacterium]|nr:phosphoglucosamine mutase [Hyphomicrobiales bacterium]